MPRPLLGSGLRFTTLNSMRSLQVPFEQILTDKRLVSIFRTGMTDVRLVAGMAGFVTFALILTQESHGARDKDTMSIELRIITRQDNPPDGTFKWPLVNMRSDMDQNVVSTTVNLGATFHVAAIIIQ